MCKGSSRIHFFFLARFLLSLMLHSYQCFTAFCILSWLALADNTIPALLPSMQTAPWGHRLLALRTSNTMEGRESNNMEFRPLRGGRLGRVPPTASKDRRHLNLQLWEASRLGRAELLASVVGQGAEINAAFETRDDARRYQRRVRDKG